MTGKQLMVSLFTCLLVAGGCAISRQGPPMAQGPAAVSKAVSLGYIVHRERQHEVRDLMSDAYRETSDDPFVRDFDPQTVFARDSEQVGSVGRTDRGEAFWAKRDSRAMSTMVNSRILSDTAIMAGGSSQ